MLQRMLLVPRSLTQAYMDCAGRVPCELGFGSLAMGRMGGGGAFHLGGVGRSRDKKLCQLCVLATLQLLKPYMALLRR